MNKNLRRETFRCTSHRCRKEVSLRIGTFFYGSRLKTTQILLMGYLWLFKMPVDGFKKMTGHGSEAACAFRKHFEHLTACAVTAESCVIGGEGIIVEIDEAKLGKRKYHRGHRVDGVWVVGGIERSPEKRVFVVPVEDRSASTLLDIIHRHVAPGSIVYTDCWRGYASVGQEYQHHQVNHSLHFVDPSSGVHTNTIEGFWNGLKLQVRPRNRTKQGMDQRLLSLIWRRQNKNALWEGFLRALSDIHYQYE